MVLPEGTPSTAFIKTPSKPKSLGRVGVKGGYGRSCELLVGYRRESKICFTSAIDRMMIPQIPMGKPRRQQKLPKLMAAKIQATRAKTQFLKRAIIMPPEIIARLMRMKIDWIVAATGPLPPC